MQLVTKLLAPLMNKLKSNDSKITAFRFVYKIHQSETTFKKKNNQEVKIAELFEQ